MQKIKEIFFEFKKSYLQVASAALLILLAALLLWITNVTSYQSIPSLLGRVIFEGQYMIGDGEWQEIKPGEHIPSTKGDVTLRGNFHSLTPFGDYVGIYRDIHSIAFYLDHINISFYEVGVDPYVSDIEIVLCGEYWDSYHLESDENELVEIVIHNPHKFGNENAIDEMLANIAIRDGIDFDKGVLNSGATERNIGLLFMIVAFMLLGIALFSALIHLKNTRTICMLGLVVLSAGGYFAYNAKGVSFWSDSIVTNTTMLGITMILYMIFLLISIVSLLKKTSQIGRVTVLLLALADAIIFIIPIVTKIRFYDMLVWWIGIQIIANTLLTLCLLKEFMSTAKGERWVYASVFLPLAAFAADTVGNLVGAWSGGVASQCVFVALFIVAMVAVLKLIPQSINDANKARELEVEKVTLNAQLTDSRISTMMSQIRPHFIYNTLGSIEQLCKLDPPKAGELVHNFAKYLRGNFGELDNPKPILMSQEMAHVHHYISIENVRFPDMTFTFEMNSDDFYIPALTVQPIVENAIKHGLMKLPKGGTIRVVTFETEKNYCVSVTDDGVGFDTDALHDDRKHVGLRNIRERLKVMVGGTLEIESAPGKGTKVVVKIPKEVK